MFAALDLSGEPQNFSENSIEPLDPNNELHPTEAYSGIKPVKNSLQSRNGGIQRKGYKSSR